MSVTYGFYNSLNGDRKYDALQLSRLFDGLIIDGVFASIGTCFVVKADTQLDIKVGIGKAWFQHTWTFNDAILPLTAPISEVLLDRIDAVILEIDASEAVRVNSIKIIKGTPSSAPTRPTMIKTQTVHQYPLCYIRRLAGSTVITQADITNMVGTTDTPFVTGILKTISLTELLGQWQNELDQFVAKETSDFTTWMNLEKTEFINWFTQLKKDLLAEQAFLDNWVASEQTDFIAWFNQMKGQLTADSAGKLQWEIDKEEVKRILLVGFEDGQKAFSDDGTVITSTAADKRTLVKTFTNGFLTMTSILKSANGVDIARMVKTFDSGGKLINTIISYM